MARPLRIEYPGAYYHVINRGNNQEKIYLTAFQVNITGQHAEEYPKRYTDIQIEFVLHGKDIKPKAVEQANQLSETKCCKPGALFD